jgi:hypothetical protein
MSIPPEDQDLPERPGEEQSPLPGVRLPEQEDLTGLREANLFVPEDMAPGEALNVRVWKIDATTMQAQAMRRC